MSLILDVSGEGFLKCDEDLFPCALGRAGIGQKKREGDGITPVGAYLLRKVFYRVDRLSSPPVTNLPMMPISQYDGWSDDPSSPRYNQHIKLPSQESHETLWREDGLYDLVVVIGYNDDPVIAGLGSAIFLHIATPDYSPTEGCVALKREDLLAVLENCDNETVIRIHRD